MSQGNARWGVGATGAPGPTGPPGPAGPPGAGASGAALFELAPIASPRLIGRYSSGSGVMQEMVGATAMGMMPVFTLTHAGLVPAPVTTSNRVLQDDGTWVAQSGGTPSGVTLSQQAVAGPFTVQGRFTLGTGTREDLAPGTVASLIGARWGSGLHLLHSPTAANGGFLRDDGQWGAVPGAGPTMLPAGNRREVQFNSGSGFDADALFTYNPFRNNLTVNEIGLPPHAHSASSDKLATWTASGFANYATGIQVGASGATIQVGTVGGAGPLSTYSGFSFSGVYGVGNAQRALMQPLTLSGNPLGQSGAPQDLAAPTVASMLPLFRGSGVGMVPSPTGGAQARFLGDNGQWSIPLASGVTNAQLAMRPPSIILGRTGSTGITEELVGSGVATLLPIFNDIHKGLVPGSAGGTTAFLRADGAWAIPSTSGGVSGVAFNQIQDISGTRFLGRLQGSGSIQELSPLSAASMLPRMLGSGVGLVSSPTGGTAGAFLRDDGTWQTPGGSPTGLLNSQLAHMPPLTMKGNQSSTATGAPADLTVQSVASLLGLVPIPSSVPASLFLADDGTFKIPLASGISNAALGMMLAPSVKGRFTLGSGVPEDLTGAQVASMIGNVTTTTRGLVPVPTMPAATGAFLDSRGNWSTPTGLNNGQFALMPPSTIRGRTGPTGTPENLVGSMVSTLLPLFNNVDKGLVPGSGGGTTAFLRADGSWSSPPAGGAVSGIAFNQINDVQPFTILGRGSVSSGTIAELSPLTVASMLPKYRGSGMGLVTAPTGGGPSGLYFKDDGTWGTPNLSSEVTQASGIVDWNSNPFYRVAPITGPITFFFTPPPVHRHLQLRTANGSGYKYTFPSLVRWPNGGGVPTGTDTASGLHVFNFFWHGSGYDGMGSVGFK